MPPTTAHHRPSLPPLRWIAAVAAFLLGSANAQEAPTVVRAFSGSIRGIESRLAEIRGELQTLPEMFSGSKGGSWGYHSGLHSESRRSSETVNRPLSVTVDLGSERVIDTIVLVPANVWHGAGDSRGYGFPPRFRVEIAGDSEFETTRVIAKVSDPPIADPPPAVVIDTGGVHGRYVRVTATELWRNTESNRALFALGELMVFSEGRNIAPGRAVTASDSAETKPLWSMHNLVDGQSSLGSATTIERSETNGYHSEFESSAEIEKWVQFDLGAVRPIEEIRVFPARPSDWAQSYGFGFPERFRVEASASGDFVDPVMLLDRSGDPFPNPGDNPVIIPLDDVEARFVRFTASTLWPHEGEGGFIFALAEMQVFSGGENVAPDSTLTTSDAISRRLWETAYLTDGFDSQHRIEDDELGSLRGAERRHHLTAEAGALERQLIAEIRNVTTRLVWLSSVIGIGLAASLALVFFRGRAARRRETDRLRARIASDLHDEIGSNLGSIALLSEIGGEKEDFAEINRVARETATSMQDIAWVIRSGQDTVADLVLRMREVAGAMLQKIDCTFTTTPEELPSQKISLNFKRNTLLFFKEALHNLARHSGAREASMRIDIEHREFRMRIEDNGCGFDAAAPSVSSGSGLKNMYRRAEFLRGEVSILSTLGEGTQIDLRVPCR